MTIVWIPIDNVSEAYEILDELKAVGYVADQDFTWAYNPSTWDNFSGLATAKGVEFKFTNDAVASWVGLKYGSKV